jgi:ADP-heptose:LPS heptosyltransferase
MSELRDVLIYRCGSLGDTIVALPAIQALRRAFPAARLTLMTASDTSGVLWADTVAQELRCVDDVLTYAPSEMQSPRGLSAVLRRVRTLAPDLVVYLGSDRNSGVRTWRDRLFFALAGVRRFVATASPKVTFFGRLRRDTVEYPYEVDRLVEALAAHGIGDGRIDFGLDGDPTDVARAAHLLDRPAGERPLVAMCPGAKQPAKRWPLARWAALGARLIEEQGVDVVVVGGTDEARALETVVARWPRDRWRSVAGRASVRESAEVLRQCRLYVGNDTGAMHLAAAVGTPCVAVFAAREPGRSWYPYGDAHVVLRRDVPCAGCYLSQCTRYALRCLTAIEVHEVLRACERALDAPMRAAS